MIWLFCDACDWPELEPLALVVAELPSDAFDLALLKPSACACAELLLFAIESAELKFEA